MQFFVDTADVNAIKELNALGLVDGVTTNPSLIAKVGTDIKTTIADICEIVNGPVSAEVLSTDQEGMLKEGRSLAKIAPNVVVKLPLTLDGLSVCRQLTSEEIHTNVTLCFSANQALLAAKAGATFVSPFIGRIDDLHSDGTTLIEEIRAIYDNYGYETQILGASIRNANHVKTCAIIGADAITAPPNVIQNLASHVLTDKGLTAFIADAKKASLKI